MGILLSLSILLVVVAAVLSVLLRMLIKDFRRDQWTSDLERRRELRDFDDGD